MGKNIILTGFMGAGKSTIGRKLARRIGSYFLDTDHLIEGFEGRSIPEIFREEGEGRFRELERECFLWLRRFVQRSVVSVGGGFPVYIPEIREAGIVIYLETPLEEILTRLSREDRARRPLFQNLDRVQELYRLREPIYRQLAHYRVRNREIEETIGQILRLLRKEGILPID
ncbi:MAG: shikimate kinase [Campylobacterales bacterium]